MTTTLRMKRMVPQMLLGGLVASIVTGICAELTILLAMCIYSIGAFALYDHRHKIKKEELALFFAAYTFFIGLSLEQFFFGINTYPHLWYAFDGIIGVFVYVMAHNRN